VKNTFLKSRSHRPEQLRSKTSTPSLASSLAKFLLFSLLTLAISSLPLTASSGDLSHEALFGPNKSFPYFESTSELDSNSPQHFSAANAAMLAQCSMLAYVRESAFIEKQLAKFGYSATEFFDIGGTFAYLAEDDRNIILSFRGTETADKIDYLTDARVIQKDFTQHGRAHSGFIQALEIVENQVLTSLKKRSDLAPDKTIWLTGHSLGGALATLFAIKYPDYADAIYVIGSPRAVNKKLAQHWHEKLAIYRIVNNNDLVTRIPSPPFYQHIGSTYFLSADGSLIIDPPSSKKWKDRLRGHSQFAKRLIEEHWANADFSAIPSDYFVDHSPLHYVEILTNLSRK